MDRFLYASVAAAVLFHGTMAPLAGAQSANGSSTDALTRNGNITSAFGDSITIEESLARARRSRPQMELGAATVNRAYGAARLTSLIPNPSVVTTVDERTPTHQSTVSQPLSWLVRRSADRGAGRAMVSRAVADSSQGVADVGREVQRAFYQALSATEQHRLATEQVHLADSLVRLADRRVAAGDISELERDQVAQEAMRARLLASQQREQARVARVELGRAIAWPTDEGPIPIGALDHALDQPSTAPTSVKREGMVADNSRFAGTLQGSSPFLDGAIADSTLAEARLRSARLAQIPIPAVIMGIEWGVPPNTAISTPRDARTTSIFGLSMPLPLWNQGREASAEALGASREANIRISEARLLFDAQLAAARIRLQESASRAVFARDSLFAEATRVRIGAVRLYEAGRTSVLPVMDALRMERDIGRMMVQEMLAYQEARADLTALLGLWP